MILVLLEAILVITLLVNSVPMENILLLLEPLLVLLVVAVVKLLKTTPLVSSAKLDISHRRMEAANDVHSILTLTLLEPALVLLAQQDQR